MKFLYILLILLLSVTICGASPRMPRCGECNNGGDASHYTTYPAMTIDVPIQLYYNVANLSYVNPDTPISEDVFKRAIEEAAAGWNANSPVKLFQDTAIKTSEVLGNPSGHYVIQFTKTTDQSWQAIAYYGPPGAARGIEFNTNAAILWNPNLVQAFPYYINVNQKNTLMHEMGHLLLLGHWFGGYTLTDHTEVMSWGNNTVCLGAGDVAGIAYNYAHGKYT
jgi:hypothetical protein